MTRRGQGMKIDITLKEMIVLTVITIHVFLLVFILWTKFVSSMPMDMLCGVL